MSGLIIGVGVAGLGGHGRVSSIEIGRIAAGRQQNLPVEPETAQALDPGRLRGAAVRHPAEGG